MSRRKPLLFSGPMERAILEGEKTVTRRAAPRTRADLDAMPCAHCGGTGGDHAAIADHGSMVMGQRCHPGEAQRVLYAAGILEVVCAVCCEPIIRIAVADGWFCRSCCDLVTDKNTRCHCGAERVAVAP